MNANMNVSAAVDPAAKWANPGTAQAIMEAADKAEAPVVKLKAVKTVDEMYVEIEGFEPDDYA